MRRLPPVLALLLAVLVAAALWRPWAGRPGAGVRRAHDRPVHARTPCAATAWACTGETPSPVARSRRAWTRSRPRACASTTRAPPCRSRCRRTRRCSRACRPPRTGVRLNAYGRLPDAATRGYPLLAERLREAGWRPAPSSPPRRSSPCTASTRASTTTTTPGSTTRRRRSPTRSVPGEDTVDRALAWIAAEGRRTRLFVWVHVFEPHAPYAPELPATTPTEVRYDADVARADRVLGRLLDGLTAAGRGDAAVLLAGRSRRGARGARRAHPRLPAGRRGAARALPAPRAGRARPGVRDDPVDLADVAPTLAGLAGLSWPAADARPARHGPRPARRDRSPPDRVRVAESLFGHQRYGWAQLVGAVGRDGMLVDAGGDRILWLAPAPAPRAAGGSPRRASGRPEAAALAPTLRAYRAGERQDLLRGGDVAGGYGSGARVAPFLDPQENGRLPNPYDAIPQVAAIDRLAAGAARSAPIRRPSYAGCERMEEPDPGNPELAWWRGRAWERQARADPAATAARGRGLPRGLAPRTTGREHAGPGRGRRRARPGGEARWPRCASSHGEIPPDARIALLEADAAPRPGPRRRGRSRPASAPRRSHDGPGSAPRWERAPEARERAAETTPAREGIRS